MKIAVIAPPWTPVPPPTYGGTELITDILCRGYMAAGHEVHLFASEDSTCPVTCLYSAGPAIMPPNKYREHRLFGLFMRTAEQIGFDVIHSHLEGFQPYAPLFNAPVFCTLHVDLTPERLEFIDKNEVFNYIAISEDQASSFPAQPSVIKHGLELDRYRTGDGDRDYLLFLGEISPRKGVDTAIEAAMAAGQDLVIAGYIPPVWQDWFKETLSRATDLDRISYVGPVQFPQKVKLLSRAKALLSPIRWREPFGLIIAEAMASGTPVIGMARGALPELIDHGVSGLLCRDEKEFIDAVAGMPIFDTAACRAHAEKHFDHRRMVRTYLELFASALR